VPTKAELVEFGQAKGVAVDESMLKGDIEQAIRDAGYDPENPYGTSQTQETTVADEQQQDQQEQPQQQSDQPTQQLEDPPPEQPAIKPPTFPVGDGEDQWDPDETINTGWFGSRPMRHPDDEYTLATGPDSPTGEDGPE
jgi:hypothetical protein